MSHVSKQFAYATAVFLASTVLAHAAPVDLDDFGPGATTYTFSGTSFGAQNITAGDATLSGGATRNLNLGPFSGRVYYDGNNDNEVLEIIFANPVGKVGFNYISNNFVGTLTAYNADDQVVDTVTHDNTTTLPGCFGFPCGFTGIGDYNASIVRITYDTVDNRNAWYIDNLVYESTALVPLPAAAFYMIGGMIGLLALKRRKA